MLAHVSKRKLLPLSSCLWPERGAPGTVRQTDNTEGQKGWLEPPAVGGFAFHRGDSGAAVGETQMYIIAWFFKIVNI